jgi:Glycosyl hydrolases family 15
MPHALNDEIGRLLADEYSLDRVNEIRELLDRSGTFQFPSLPNGLFSAALLGHDTKYTGYDAVWVRDNIHVAHALYRCGKAEPAARAIKSIGAFFNKYRHKFESIIRNPALADDPMNRPHVRFNGGTLEEFGDRWSHAQNDAIGYFLWLCAKLIRAGALPADRADLELLARFPPYFEAIAYWRDEDSGHWEEARKVSASSIGVVVAGLRELEQLMIESPAALSVIRDKASVAAVGDLISQGSAALDAIFPNECIQQDPKKQRRHDAALLFLIYPTEVVSGEMADTIVENVLDSLKGPIGIKRYIGDSFWCTDYRSRLSKADRTRDYSDDIGSRDALLTPGEEAQWCLFDPIISIHYATKYRTTRNPEDLSSQVEYLNRSLGQITGNQSRFGPFLCPELYHIESGKVEPSDATPLLWTQGNIGMALKSMEESLQ